MTDFVNSMGSHMILVPAQGTHVQAAAGHANQAHPFTAPNDIMSYGYIQSPGACFSRDILDHRVPFTADLGGVATAKPGSSCRGPPRSLSITDIPGQPNHPDLDPIEDLTEAQWGQKFAEFWGEDAPFIAASRSTDDSWANDVDEERSFLDSMKELATSEVPLGWTIPRVFSQCGHGEAVQGKPVDELQCSGSSRELEVPIDFTFEYPPIIPSGAPLSTPPAPVVALPPTAGLSESDAWPHFSPALRDASSPTTYPLNDAARTSYAVVVKDPCVSHAPSGTPAPPVANPSDKENKAVAGPSTGTRVQPKRKRANVPTLITASERKPPRKAPSKTSTPAAAAPPRKRCKVAELEDIEMTPETRCGLGGCATVLRAPDLATARAHMHAHIAPPPPPPAPRLKGSSSKGKERAADQGELEPQEKTPLHCSYRTLAGAACTHAPLSNEQALQRHIEGEHYSWKFPCGGCGKRFPRRDALARHYKAKPKCRPAGFKLT